MVTMNDGETIGAISKMAHDIREMKLATGGLIAGYSRKKFLECIRRKQALPAFEIYGNGEIGDKARNLKLYQKYLLFLGFALPPRYILTESILNSFSNLNLLNDPTESLRKKLQFCKLINPEKQLLLNILELITEKYLYVRSSANGDSRGTGLFTSIPCLKRLDVVENAIIEIIDSYYKLHALNFFKNQRVSVGGGIIIEPLISADFSGFCYTSLSSSFQPDKDKGGEYCQFAPFIGGGNQHFSRESYLDAINTNVNLDNIIHALRFENDQLKQVLIPQPGYVSRKLFYGATSTCAPAYHLNFLQYALTQIEIEYGEPHYLEYAATDGQAILRHFGYDCDSKDLFIEPLFWIIQIAKVPKSDTKINNKLKNIVFEANELSNCRIAGTGITYHTPIVIFSKNNDDSLRKLERFNKNRKGYILIIDAKNLKTILYNHKTQSISLQSFYQFFGNCSAIIETSKTDDSECILRDSHNYGFAKTIGVKVISDHATELDDVKNKLEVFGVKNIESGNGLEIFDCTALLQMSETLGSAILSVCQ